MYLVCGEALFDVFSQENSTRSSELGLTAIAGGSPFNVAVGLRRLGVESAMFGGLSSDYLGARLRRVLEEERVDCRYVVTSDAPTTLAMVGLDAGGSAHYQFRGEGCADRQVKLEHLPELDERVRGVHVGSYTLVVKPVADTLMALVERERDRRLISLDPNVRLNPQPDVALWRRQVEAFAAHAHVIKASDEDLALLYPGRETRDVARGWLNERCRLVFVTHGADGASVHCAHGSWQRPADTSLPVRDTVGAGDTFQAAVLAYLARLGADTPARVTMLDRATLDALLDFAIRAAAITCSRVGPDLPFEHEV
ncbi:carbohydrate kinase family protein [Pseudomonas sp. UFMG81]|uniref:carbohydrate kinase family protein n=1 Tax=Pseudomonas sp. UFMG81 TaxID=2745936 RepID=UPI00188E174C|nr:carbohydrate kinase [Pseudomonas sp. UFMG81]